MSSVYKVCSECGEAQRLFFSTDGNGRLLEDPLGCGCDPSRHLVTAADRCQGCDADVSRGATHCRRCQGKKDRVPTWRELHPREHAILAAAQSSRRGS